MQKNNKLGAKLWITVILFGLVGQIAWIVENMYFNVYIDRTMSTNPFAISIMVGASAIVATFATLIGGIWSDKIGHRKYFMSIGYIVWGLSIMAFSLIKVSNMQEWFGLSRSNSVIMAITFVVLMDCVMTYIGSTSNDACFNAWVTDNTNTRNRGRIEGVLAIMPLLATGLVFGVFDGMTQDTYKNPLTGETKLGWAEGWQKIQTGNWTLFFVILGSIIILVGIISLFLIKDSPTLKPNETSKFKNMFYGFKPKIIKENKNLYLTLVAMGLIGIANNSFMAYLIMYIERTLGFSNYIIPVGIIIFGAAVSSVIFGFWVDNKLKDRRKTMIPLVIIYVFGALFMLVASPLCFEKGSIALMVMLCIGGFILMGTNLCLATVLTATTRDLTPIDKIGLFQGVRMFFWVLIPMIIGPLVTAIINSGSPIVAEDTVNNIVIRNYTPLMFIASAIAGGLAIIPVVLLNKASLEEMHPFDDNNINSESLEVN
ncbi:MAG: MFS transporter [Clostridia bacterium]